MNRREKRKSDAYKAKKKKYKKRRKEKQRNERGDCAQKLENLTTNFYSSPYPQATADVIEKLESEKQISDRKFQRKKEKRKLIKARQEALQAYQGVVSQYDRRVKEDETSRRGWMHLEHQEHSLQMRKLELDELKRRYDYERNHAQLLRERWLQMKKEDSKAAKVIQGLSPF